jgi:hypothetical protein
LLIAALSEEEIHEMPLIDTYASSDNLYSIVVVGNMNPAIHHPRWYKDIGILDEKEVTEAEERPSTGSDNLNDTSGARGNLVVSQFATQFTTRSLRIVCNAQSWSVLTVDEGKLEKCLNLASAVFKELDSTPVSAYGFNFNHHRQTRITSVGEYLAELTRSLTLGFAAVDGQPKTANISYSASLDGEDSNVTIAPSIKDSSMVFVAMNFNHPIVQGTGFFELDRMLTQDFPHDRERADRYLQAILAPLN